MDTTNLTQNNTIRVKYQIDGTNYRTFQTISWNTAMEDGILIEGDIPVAVSKALRVTMQSGTTEGADRSISGEYWVEGLGSGAVTFTYTVTNSITSAAIGNVEVWVTTDSAGANIVASGITNSSGQVVLYLNNNSTYFFWRKHSDYSFTNPDQEDVAV